MRIGQSQDIHRFKEGRKLILGGIEIPYQYGLDGHSDADVLLHAIIEAIIGAMALGDIGSHFPDNDDKYLNISSLLLLDETYRLMVDEGYEIGNVDSLVIMEKPKLRNYIDQMREKIAQHLHCDISQINVKATTSEKMGFVGNGEGVIAQAVVLLNEKEKKEMMTYKITVEDIMCENCARKIRTALESADDKTVASVDVKKKTVTVDTDLKVEKLYEIIEDAGFTPGDLELI